MLKGERRITSNTSKLDPMLDGSPSAASPSDVIMLDMAGEPLGLAGARALPQKGAILYSCERSAAPGQGKASGWQGLRSMPDRCWKDHQIA